MSDILILNGRLVDPAGGVNTERDVLLRDGRVAAVERPGVLRGVEAKETIEELPAAVRASEAPIIPASFAVLAVIISVAQEVAFRGVLYAALDEAGGAPLAIAGSTVAWTAAHALSHPPEFLWAVAASGLLLALWRWACRDLVAPIIGHVLADLAL